ncbi:MAG TPA: sugar diacid recognition domain-containing protein [Bacillales bacterium]|nr:sugar diacid recognition domain-containing protein [Bacillales bacterium]
MLTREIAENIVRETMKTLGRNINIMDENGMILSSGDPERIGTFHEAAQWVIETENPFVIDQNNQEKWRGTKPGVNLPIRYQDKVIGVVGISGTPEEVEEFGAMVVMMTELMIQQMVLMTQVEWKQRTREFLLEEILSERPPKEKIEQKCRLLNITLRPPFQPLVFRFHGEQHLTPREVYDRVGNILTEAASVYGFIDAETFVVLLCGNFPDDDNQKLRKTLVRLYKDVRLGAGRVVENLDDLSLSYQEAVLTLRLIKKSLVKTEDCEARLLVHRANQAERGIYRQRVLKTLPGDLLETMNAFFENDLNLSRTAKQLFIHRNTLIYRINRIQEITGYDPRNFRDAVTLQLADWCREVE